MGEFPNKSTQFKKGQSGNPEGKSLETFADLYRFYTENYSREELVQFAKTGKNLIDLPIKAKAMLVIRRIVRAFSKDNALSAIEDRVEGKPDQTVKTPDITQVQFIDPIEKEL